MPSLSLSLSLSPDQPIENSQQQAPLPHRSAPTHLVLPEGLEDLVGVAAGIRGAHLLHARRRLVLVLLQVRALVALDQLRHPEVAEVLQEEEGRVPRRRSLGAVVALDGWMDGWMD